MMDKTTLTFGEIALPADPFAAFGIWLRDAEASEPNDPNAMSLATVDSDGLPDVRMVLLKGFDRRGFVFYTNFESRKGEEIRATRKAALNFHWKSLHRQIRIRGDVEIVSDEEADAYYASRARESRIGAWASLQSRPLENRETLERRVEDLGSQYGEGPIPRPPVWSGFRVVPREIEFWHDGAFRLHDRYRLTRTGADDWTASRLYP